MINFLNKIKSRISSLPKAYWVFVGFLLVAELGVYLVVPDKPGLYTWGAQYIPFAVALPFLFVRSVRKPFNRFVYTYAAVAFFFLGMDYLVAGHAGLIQIAVTFIPLGLYLLFRFSIWNFKRLREKDSRTALLLSTIAWGAMALAFPPLPLGPAALLLLVPWFLVLNRYSRSSAIFATFWSGMVYNGINYYWIFNVMNVETAPSAIIFLGVVLLVAFFSLYSVVAAFIYTLIKNIKIRGYRVFWILYPVFYSALEMTRTRGDFAFPWSHLGYVFGNHLELLQALSLIGIFGYTCLIVASNMLVADSLGKPGIMSKWPFALPALILVILLVHGKITLSAFDAIPFYGSAGPNNPQIAMVQPCIQQGEKWSKERYNRIIDKTLGMVQDSVKRETDLIILAETAIPDHIRRQPATIERLHKVSNHMNASILVGALDFKRNREPDAVRRYEIYNASFLFTPGDNDFPQRYIKKHLVPFSERIPFDDIFPILNYVDLGEGDFVPGKETPVYEPFLWTPFICYDAIFGDLVRDAIRAGSRFMVNITNDGWFGRSTAPYQHLNLVRYRAIENGFPVARLANSGVSAFVDQYGHMDMNTPIFEDAVIQRKMQLKTRDTLYQHIGDDVETALLYFFAIYLIAAIGCRLTIKVAAASGRP